MLSRVADSLYWMGRYLERAENVARIVDVNSQLMLDLPTGESERIQRNWLPVVACLGEDGEFRRRYPKADAGSVIEFLVFDLTHGNSITGSLAAARENARTVREQINPEMWEQVNRTYLWLMSRGARQFFNRNAYDFFQRVKKSLQLFHGITDSAMMHGAGWEFLQMGRHLERADKVSRLLDDEFFLVRDESVPGGGTLTQWQAILRSSNARQTYQRIYASVVDPVKVADLLLLHDEFPRSVEFCVREVDSALRRLSGVAPGRFCNLAEKLSGRLLSDLSFSSIEEIWARGLHDEMDLLQQRLNDLGGAILDVYMHPSTPITAPTPAPPVAVAQVPQ